MLILKNNIGSPSSFLEQIARELNLNAEDGLLEIPSSLGKGSLQHMPFNESLNFYHCDFSFHQDVFLSTTNPRNSGVFNIILNRDPFHFGKKIGDKEIEVVSQFPKGILFQSQGTPAGMHLKAGNRYTFSHLLFKKKVLDSYGVEENTEEGGDYNFTNFLDANHEAYFHDIDVLVESKIDAILEKEQDSLSGLLQRDASILNLLAYLVQLFDQLSAIKQKKQLKEGEVATLFSARQMLTSDLSQDSPGIEELAQKLEISESRLKRLFKQFFGRSISQYVQYSRMLEAQKLFTTGKYNISEVAEQVGYNNITHFGNAFKRYFHVKPKTFLRQLPVD